MTALADVVRRLSAPLAALGLACACALAAACTPDTPPGQPAGAVERFHAAIAAGDCRAARAELGAAYLAKLEREGVDCSELLEAMQPSPLEAVLETKVDGRDPDARLVRARIAGRRHDVIIRVSAEDGRWKILSH